MKTTILGLVLAVVITVPVAGQRTFVVDLNGGGDFTEIQAAIDAAGDGDSILVKPGEYVITEPVDFNRLHDPEDPNSPPVKNITVRSEAGAEQTIIRMSDQPADPDRAGVVVLENGESEKSVLQGFLLSGAKLGGGVCCTNKSSPTLANCTISGNSTRGVKCAGDSSPSLTNCVISGNSGGGVYCTDNSSPTFTNCTITGNVAGGGGGGVLCANNSSPVLTNCAISGNKSEAPGGGVSCQDSSPVLTNCTISGNYVDDDDSAHGGGIYCYRSSPTLTNCIISGNYVCDENDGRGSAVDCTDSSPTLTNCTITGNRKCGRNERAVIYSQRSTLTLTNCIVWNNHDGMSRMRGTPQMTYSCIEGGDVLPGSGNINKDPRFVRNGVFNGGLVTLRVGGREHDMPDFIVDPGDYRLQPGSPCIDSGTLDGAPTTDIDGNGRPCGEGVDMGTYESGACPAPTERFKRGDANADGKQNLTDAVFVLDHLFGGGKEPPCAKSADMNDSGTVDLTDPVFLLNFLFSGRRPRPPAPFSECGPDPTIDDLSCLAFEACQ